MPVVLFATGFLLAVSEVLPTLGATHLVAIGVHAMLAGAWAGRRLSWVAALAVLPVHGTVAMVKAGTYAFPDVIVDIDASGDAYGPEYPRGPKVLLRTLGDPGTRNYYFRPLILGVLLGPSRTPYNG